MPSLRLPSLVGILSIIAAAASANTSSTRGYPTAANNNSNIQWKPCPADLVKISPLAVECGTLAVPLDYSDPDSTQMLNLSLVRIPAIKKNKEKGERRHSILFNLGGPGLEVRYSLAELGDMFQVITGGEHDLIGWDPRGTAETLTYSCFANATGRAAVLDQLPPGNASDVARGLLWAGGQNYADACASYPDALRKGPLIDSSSTARDAMRIVDALEEDGMLRYYGLSYGTALGAEIVAMFPDRVEKMVLDGVVNPTEYFYEMTLAAGTLSTDATFSEFFRQCVSSPEYCPLAQHRPGIAPSALEAQTYDLIDELRRRPFAYDGLVIGYAQLESSIRFALYAPQLWHFLANDILDSLLVPRRNDTLAGEGLYGLTSSSSNVAEQNDAQVGIACVDKVPRSDSFDHVSSVLDQAAAKSRLLGDAIAPLYAICAQWKVEAPQRYRGGFHGVRPRKPLLVIGNTYDPATSIISARNLTDTIKPSVLLQHGGVGHSSIQHPSLCTARAMQAYFLHGTLPKPDTLCEPVTPPFQFAVAGPTWQQLFPQLGFDLDSLRKKSVEAARSENGYGGESDGDAATVRLARRQKLGALF
ncbi:hypothetical protein F5Y17DRAFT_460913 [Xylariaceae sp. FL0594]|nr:hypothetical protein F5Y17DRAFT_460913 [Xylariaceae sp. FL0594]